MHAEQHRARSCAVSFPHLHPRLCPSHRPDCQGSRVKREMRERTGSHLRRVCTT
ncbi:hypothetical protein M405DRAFT_812315 [Rhizopogon salebrosus TDB-379]|nr:hypothetical protein M405DRAFT_812315 [Rhizopogon salebrosus TDB-379]